MRNKLNLLYQDFKKLLNKEFLYFGVLQFITSILSILVGKFIAIKFSPSVFGDYSLIVGGVALITGLIATPSIMSYRFAYNKHSDSFLISFYQSIFFWTLIVLLLLVGVLRLIFDFNISYAVILWFTLFFQFNQELLSARINIKGKNKLYAKVKLLVPVVSLTLIFVASNFCGDNVLALLLYILGLHFFMWLVLYVLSNKITLQKIISILDLYHTKWFKEFLIYIRPLLILPAFSWLVNYGDKYLIDVFFDSDRVGIYSAAYSISSKIFLLSIGVMITFFNKKIFELGSNKMQFNKLWQLIKKLVLAYITYGIFLIICLFFSYSLVGGLLLSENYNDSFILIPYLAIGLLLMTSFQFFEQAGYATGNTNYILTNYILGAIINIGLNIILMPLYGLFGTSISLIISSFLQLAFLSYKSRKVLLVN